MIGNKHNAFVLLPWDLDKLDLETANPTFYLIEVFLHPFTLVFVATVDLTGYDLRVVVYDHILSPCCSCEVQSYYQGLILCLIVGGMKFELDHAFHLIFFWGDEHHTYPSCLPIGRSVRINIPLWSLLYSLVVLKSELGDKVSHNLPFHSCSRLVLYIKLTQLYCL